MSYKTITWTIRNNDVLNILNEYTGWNKHPQEFIRKALYDAGIVRVNATKMISQTNFGAVTTPLKVSLYSEDAVLLKEAATAAGLTIQKLLEQVVLTNTTTTGH
jgi:hypothetical protein